MYAIQGKINYRADVRHTSWLITYSNDYLDTVLQWLT